MPYIDPERRKAILGESTTDYDTTLRTPGELNYYITYVLKEYLQNKGECYQTYNDILGALEGAKLEMYRIHIAPYENKKIKENGEVVVGKNNL